jgi:putative heme-binding domain-containing protein
MMSAVALWGWTWVVSGADPFAEFVRSSDPLTPEKELLSFHLPSGFEIQLVAAEPAISKPMNMAFDAKGRLWVTESREYPFPAPKNRKGRDAIKILEDADGDGRAEKITTFADGLNIPIGLYPYRDGAIAFSIPNIYHFRDTDGDGRADQQEILYGPIGFEKDTHGMTSSFRRGFDGWIYACHGFNNTTTIKGKDGSSITMNSGNTYRMKVDGSRVEQFTHGQVNPFGLMFDPLGNLYSADCHSSPVYQLLRDGYYPSFGKPDDGLGFGPAMMNHSHNSTAIGGIVYYAANQFPPEFRGNVFVGNVMTCRINRDSLLDMGSTRIAREETDLLRSDDPWFRPVDLQLGPDGALYVADFYNRIIGHYEVPLDHPGRDRERGRIWRISYRKDRPEGRPKRFDLSKASPASLVSEMANANLTRRMLAMNELIDRVGTPAIKTVKAGLGDKAHPLQVMHGLWVLHRLGGLDEKTLEAAARHGDAGVRVHAMRVLSETPSWSDQDRALAQAGLQDADAFVQRAAADALGRHVAVENIRPLLDLRHRVPVSETHLLYTVRMALRNQFQAAGTFAQLPLPKWTEADARAIADVAVGVPSAQAGTFLLTHIQMVSESRETLSRYLRHAVRYVSAAEVDALADFVRSKFADDIDFQLALFKAAQEGKGQREESFSSAGWRAWGSELAEELLTSSDEPSTWRNTPVPGMTDSKNPWFVQKRVSADGDNDSPFLCSLPPGGERLTGILRSQTFVFPGTLKFFLAGHDGFPDKPPQHKNSVRLRDADTHQLLLERFAPRNDTAQPVILDLPDDAGMKAYLEVVDGDDGNAYAWLAIGRFDPPLIEVPKIDPSQITKRQQAAADLARLLPLPTLEPKLTELLLDSTLELEARSAAARALLAFNPNEDLEPLSPLIADAAMPGPLREKICGAVAGKYAVAPSHAILVESSRSLPRRLQIQLAQSLAASANGAENLLRMVSNREAPASVLLERSVKEKMLALKRPNIAARLEELTAGLKPPSEEVQKMIDKRRKNYNAATTSATDGERVFTQNCRACHQLDGIGSVIGPQLDGIGNRGLERLCEDILDPNRSIDPAFRSSLWTLKDGDVVSGLFRRNDGETVVLADTTGKEISIPKKQIAAQRESEISLMPENFGELLSESDLNDLLTYLLSKGSVSSGKP